MRNSLRLAGFCFLLSLSTAMLLGAESQKPNILFLFTDDQRYDTIHTLGNDWIHTPNLDRFAKAGTSFDNAYIMGSSSPAVCSPSRASLFSGRTLWRLENQGMWGYEISEKYATLPQVFRENGYVTFATGKNEPGRRGHFARSFSAGDKILFRGMTSSQYRLPLFSYSPTGDYSGRKQVMHTGTHSAEVYANACISFLKGHRGSAHPFFAYVAFQTPHDPRQSPQDVRAMYEETKLPIPKSFMPKHPFDNGMLTIRDEKLAPFPRTKEIVQKHLADYYATITHTDAQIGRILQTLEDSGQRDNTIIVFTSDNGLAVGRHGLMGKQNVYEHSVRVPLIIAGPDISRHERRQQLCYIYDLYPTLCDLAKLDVPKTVEFRSLARVLANDRAAHREQLYFAFMSWQRAIRRGKYKLIEYCAANERHTQLFDVVADPHELDNLTTRSEMRSTVDELREQLKAMAFRLGDGTARSEFTRAQGEAFWTAYNAGRSDAD